MNNKLNLLDNLKQNRFGKTAMGVGLSLAILLSGSALLTPQSAAAATNAAASNAANDESANATSDTANPSDAAASASIADNVIATGKQFLGVDYQFGAKGGQTNSFDCSSYTQYVFKQNGIDLPRSSRQQAQVGTKVAKSDLQPGDLVFSDTNKDGVINHVSIYIGNGQLLQTYRVGIGVTVSNFEGSVWDKTFVTARRVLEDNQTQQVSE
ncbi:C40 family peptidase [Cohnella sp. AR92]|uniref:C40 family peptidase n=1 Tax=Cohnella sp. AR92 TaxID=648716 RepID=UPI0018655D92|nr:C40 family peptidase [Cohnella sp. AR92]